MATDTVRYVRWKRYGFTHVVDENRNPNDVEEARDYLVNYVGGWTVCGNWWHITSFNDPMPGMEMYSKGKLPPSEVNDNERPLCGNCRKYLEKRGDK